MQMRGEYVIQLPNCEKEIVLPNTLVQNGQNRLMQAALQSSAISGFAVGVMDEVPAYTALIANITTEPTSAGGYARQAIAASAAGWTISSVNGEARCESATVTFTASGADFSRAFSRFFLIDTSVGGDLISYSSPLNASILLLDGQSFSLRYRLYYK